VTRKPGATRKPKPKVSKGALSTPLNEPLPDWVLLWKAPFFCLDDRMHTDETWAPACREMAKSVSFSLLDDELAMDNEELLLNYKPPRWEISSHESSIFVRAMGITTHIWPGAIWVGRDGRGELYGWSDQILRSDYWDEFLLIEEWKEAGEWHREFLSQFLRRLRRNFRNHVSSGAAQLFARLRSPLAQFERIFPDQWHFMKLEPQEQELELRKWCDPEQNDYADQRPMSAGGPDGERIYSIYVARGEERFDELEAKEKCRQSLVALVREFPKRQPRPKPLIIREQAHSFGLSERIVESILSKVATDEGNTAWSKPGRLK
jgi:hypothetical protein